MRVLLTSTGIETKEIQDFFLDLLNMDTDSVKALFIPTAAIYADAIAVLPKCMNDLLKCGIQDKNIKVYDLHKGMDIDELRQYDVVYLCGGDPHYLLQRINEAEFNNSLMQFIREDGVVVGVSAGSLIFANNMPDNLGLIETNLYVHCAHSTPQGKIACPFRDNICLSNTSALAVRSFPDELEIIE